MGQEGGKMEGITQTRSRVFSTSTSTYQSRGMGWGVKGSKDFSCSASKLFTKAG